MWYLIVSIPDLCTLAYLFISGDKLDNSLYQLLQGGVPDMLDRQMDAQMTLASIDKLIQEYRLRQVVQAKAADRK